MFVKNKGRGKHRKGNKSGSKSGSTAQQTASDGMPDNFGFLYSIDSLDTKYEGKNTSRILLVRDPEGSDVAKLWFPPNRQHQFRRRRGNIYRWPGDGDQSEMLRGVDPHDFKRYQVASVFFQARQDNFLAVLKDCTECDIAKEIPGWSQVGFHHLRGLLSMVDTGGEEELLAAPADGSSWMPQVIPAVYNYDMKNPSAKSPGPSGGLCGRLSLLIAMAAFSAPATEAEDIVAKCFGNTWEEHAYPTGIGRYRERGVLVKIFLDPEATGVTAEHLKAFEHGKYGPIFLPPPLRGQEHSYEQGAPPTGYVYGSPAPIPTSSGYGSLPTVPPGYSYASPAAIPRIFPPTHATAAPSGYPPRTLDPSENIYSQDDDPQDEQPEEEGGN